MSRVQIRVLRNSEELSRNAADFVFAALRQKPGLIFCASAGGTPTLLYELMAACCRRTPELFRQMTVLQIDEWVGIPAHHPASCRSDLQKKLIDPLGIPPRRFISFAADSPDPQDEANRIARWLLGHGPIDVCILGLGVNGHLAMNEPAPAFTPRAHVVKLARSSLGHSMLRDLKPKPRYGLTVGMADILCSRLALLLVSGESKQEAMARFLEGKVTTSFPASLLWLHPNAAVLCDRKSIR
jgi:galactosamine-6-phosphate isomerase